MTLAETGGPVSHLFAVPGAGAMVVDGAVDRPAARDGEPRANPVAAARASQRVIAVADSSKLGRVAFGHVCDLDDIDIVVTDAEADQRIVDELRAAGVDVRCV